MAIGYKQTSCHLTKYVLLLRIGIGACSNQDNPPLFVPFQNFPILECHTNIICNKSQFHSRDGAGVGVGMLRGVGDSRGALCASLTLPGGLMRFIDTPGVPYLLY